MYIKRVLFINGIPDDLHVKVGSIQKNGQPYLIYNGGANIFDFINDESIKKYMLMLDANKTQDVKLVKSAIIFNQISDADTHKVALTKLKNIYKFFPKNTTVLNDPSQILKTTRDNIYALLKDIPKVDIPKTLKIKPKSPSDIYNAIKKAKLAFPIMFRKAGDHGGISTILLEDDSENFYAFALDGNDYYLTQFVEYKRDGVYIKYRLVVVNGEVFLRHMIVSDKWIIHSGSRDFMQKQPKYQVMEQKALKNFEKEIKPKIQQSISKLYQVTKLDYFGIDCSIDSDFNLLIFELNANMNVLINNAKDKENIWSEPISKIQNAITQMILKA